MFNLTDSPEFMAALRTALLAAVADAGINLGGGVQEATDPENDWLTPKEAMAFLRLSPTSLHKHQGKFVISYSLGKTEPRYQRASLQKFMRGRTTREPETAPLPFETSAKPTPKPPTNGRHRAVELRVSGGR